MRSLPEPVLQLLDEGKIIILGLIVFVFGTGTYRFVRDVQPFTDPDGNVYAPGSLIEVSDLTGTTGTVADKFTVTLAASPDDGLTPAVLQTIETEDYRDRPCTIYDALIHPVTNQTLFVDPVMRGYVDVIDHETDAQQGYRLVASCESRALDFSRSNARRRTHQDQQRRASGDRFYEHASRRRTEELNWGSLKTGAGLPAPAAAPAVDGSAALRKFFGGFGLKV